MCHSDSSTQSVPLKVCHSKCATQGVPLGTRDKRVPLKVCHSETRVPLKVCHLKTSGTVGKCISVIKTESEIALPPNCPQLLQTFIYIAMPLTAAQLTAFWTSPNQMGFSARTRTQIAAEGLVTPDDFKDFNNEATWTGCSRFSQSLRR